MRQTNPLRRRLAVLGIAGLVLLNFPILALPGGVVAGWPGGIIYVFGVWALLIALAALLAER